MQYTTLGRTGLRVSVMGLGCGGHSRIGQSTGKTEEESVRIVREALDLGTNFIDTAEAYKTEEIVGRGIRGVPRDQVVLSTKKSTWADGQITESDVLKSLEASLKKLGTEYVDVYHLHGVTPEKYPYLKENIVPVLLRLRDEGKIRHLGITEMFGRDTGHQMLQMALPDDCWDVVMVGFNLLNQTARDRVFPLTQQRNVGTLIMFAVRQALSKPARLREILQELKDRGKITPELAESPDPLAFLYAQNGAESLQDAAYRFCRYEPGADVILSGTGEIDHLRVNAASFDRPDIPEEHRRRLAGMFGKVDDVSGS